jgi:hypothetical protein
MVGQVGLEQLQLCCLGEHSIMGHAALVLVGVTDDLKEQFALALENGI